MSTRTSLSRKIFMGFNYIFLACAGMLCLFPLLHVLAVSFSSSAPAGAGLVKLWPMGFTLKSYEFVMNRPEFVRSFLISVERVALGLPICMLLTVLLAYPLSKEKSAFRARTGVVWFFMVTMLFSGGLIPTYMVVNMTHLIDTIWALIIPGAVNTFNVVLMLNFFRNLPKELEDAGFMDGAGHWTLLFKIFLPLSKPSLATIALFIMVGHWNSWFDGLIFMNSPKNYPLQSLLQTLVIQVDPQFINEHNLTLLHMINDRTSRAAEIFVAMVPILIVYPFLQKYFTTGIVLGSVKG